MVALESRLFEMTGDASQSSVHKPIIQSLLYVTRSHSQCALNFKFTLTPKVTIEEV